MRRTATLDALRVRSDVLRAIRNFFHRRGFTEVETPVRLPAPALELHIEAEPSGDWFLRTSPELHLKRLLADGARRIFELGACFRKGELGRCHRPEYCMLEWYRGDADYWDALADCRELLPFVCSEVLGTARVRYAGRTIDLSADWRRTTVSAAFREHAGWDPVADYDADRFDLDLVTRVEPALDPDRPVVLFDYPAAAAALARCRAGDPPVAERWELYAGGLELANAFSELTDPAEQRRRFEACAAKRRADGLVPYPLDEEFLAALTSGMPPAAGVALGVDRLVMLLCGADSIEDVRAFA